jgi:hypothetical protein
MILESEILRQLVREFRAVESTANPAPGDCRKTRRDPRECPRPERKPQKQLKESSGTKKHYHVLLLFPREDFLIEIILHLLVRNVNHELFKSIARLILEAENVQQAN